MQVMPVFWGWYPEWLLTCVIFFQKLPHYHQTRSCWAIEMAHKNKFIIEVGKTPESLIFCQFYGPLHKKFQITLQVVHAESNTWPQSVTYIWCDERWTFKSLFKMFSSYSGQKSNLNIHFLIICSQCFVAMTSSVCTPSALALLPGYKILCTVKGSWPVGLQTMVWLNRT